MAESFLDNCSNILSNRITKVSQEHRLWTEILPVWQNPVKAATYFKSVVPAGSCTLVQEEKMYGCWYTCDEL